jgi:hypothetical protein
MVTDDIVDDEFVFEDTAGPDNGISYDQEYVEDAAESIYNELPFEVTPGDSRIYETRVMDEYDFMMNVMRRSLGAEIGVEKKNWRRLRRGRANSFMPGTRMVMRYRAL